MIKTIKNISAFFFTLIMMFACNDENNLSTNNNISTNTVTAFLIDISSLEKDTNDNPIIAFQKQAEELADDKIVFNKKNIKEVLIKSRDYANSVITTANHTIVKIESIDNCQQSGSWKACMPYVKGYVKKGKLNYKADYMNNVIGIPDGQQRIAYFFNNNELNNLLPYSSFYENGNFKLTGEGFEKFDRILASKKDGLILLESMDFNSKQIAKIPFGTEISVISNEGKWTNVRAEFYLSPGDEGYFIDLIEPSTVEGYVLDELLEAKQDSMKKPGVWTYYYQSGIKEKEEYHFEGRLIKKIDYDKDGDVIQIEEYRNDDLWDGLVNVNYFKNGKIKSKSDAEDGGAVRIDFDEYGNVITDKYGSGNMINHFDKIILSKDIKEFHLSENQQLNK